MLAVIYYRCKNTCFATEFKLINTPCVTGQATAVVTTVAYLNFKTHTRTHERGLHAHEHPPPPDIIMIFKELFILVSAKFCL